MDETLHRAPHGRQQLSCTTAVGDGVGTFTYLAREERPTAPTAVCPTLVGVLRMASCDEMGTKLQGDDRREGWGQAQALNTYLSHSRFNHGIGWPSDATPGDVRHKTRYR